MSAEDLVFGRHPERVVNPGELAARGPRAEGHADALRAAVAAVHEGYEHHYGAAQAGDGRDLALLDGDRRYADGLAQLAALGDLIAIAELADAVWTAGATAIGWGTTPELVGAKARARASDPAAPDALRDAASNVRRPSPHG